LTRGIRRRRHSGTQAPKPTRADSGKKTPEEVQKILKPDVLSFDIERTYIDPTTKEQSVKPYKLMVPTQFTLGDLVQREVAQDFDAYVRLVMVELGEVSSVDVKADPQLMFTRQNMRYLDVVLVASNVRTFMGRVLSKSATSWIPTTPMSASSPCASRISISSMRAKCRRSARAT
jgi:hypothetical protein